MSDYEKNESGGFWILSARLDFETSGWSDGVTWLGGSPKLNLGLSHTVIYQPLVNRIIEISNNNADLYDTFGIPNVLLQVV